MEKIIVDIDDDGRITIKTEGFAGPGCKAATKNLEKALGTVRSAELTADYHKREAQRHVQKR